MAEALDVPWDEIEKFCIIGGSIPDASIKFGVKMDTIRKRAKRWQWPLPRVIAKAVAKKRSVQRAENEALIEQKAIDWESKGEAHRRTVFDLAHQSLKKMRPQAPKNFREAEAADKMARRAAGLDNIETVNQTLIQLNEAMNDNDVIEAEVVEAPICVLSEPDSLGG